MSAIEGPHTARRTGSMSVGSALLRTVTAFILSSSILVGFLLYLTIAAFDEVVNDPSPVLDALNEADAYARVYEVRPSNEEIDSVVHNLLGGFTFSVEEQADLLRQIVPRRLLRDSTEDSLGSLAEFLSRESQELDIALDLGPAIPNIKPTLTQFIVTRVDELPGTPSQQTGELVTGVRNVLLTIDDGRLPSDVPTAVGLEPAIVVDAYVQALDLLDRTPSFSREGLASLQEANSQVTDAIMREGLRRGLTLAASAVAAPRIDSAISELQEELDQGRFDLVERVARSVGSRAQVMRDLRASRFWLRLVTGLGPSLSLTLALLGVITMGLVFVPHWRHVVLWPSMGLLVVGALFLLLGWLLTTDYHVWLRVACGPSEPSCRLAIDVGHSLGDHIGTGFILPSGIVAAIGAVGVIVSIFFTGRRGRRLAGQAASGVMSPMALKFALFLALSGFLVGLMVITLPFLVVLGGPWGYTAGFLISLANSATIVIPAPGFAAILIMARELNPIWLGIAAGVGGTFGELSGYYAGMRGSATLEGNKFHNTMRGYMDRSGGAVIFVSGLVPIIPIDVAGLVAGSTRYPIRKFLFYLGIGKTAMYAGILYLTVRAFEWAEPFLGFFT